jgi:hypothetical protein
LADFADDINVSNWMRGLAEQGPLTNEQFWRISLADMLEELGLLER